ncbi:hypothetical protein RB196_30850 [Streptomyces sp. PmtA]|uniref:hypothetical protein n=1 Tax=Streptomyces sp. PmtA TaxID=3074275 RepID=UPI003014C029
MEDAQEEFDAVGLVRSALADAGVDDVSFTAETRGRPRTSKGRIALMHGNRNETQSPDAAGDDKGCLRWVIGVPLALLHLLAGFLCFYAIYTRPGHPGDEDALFAIEAFAVLTIATGAVALLITLAPAHRAALNRWWLVPPVALMLAAGVRLALPV